MNAPHNVLNDGAFQALDISASPTRLQLEQISPSISTSNKKAFGTDHIDNIQIYLNIPALRTHEKIISSQIRRVSLFMKLNLIASMAIIGAVSSSIVLGWSQSFLNLNIQAIGAMIGVGLAIVFLLIRKF